MTTAEIDRLVREDTARLGGGLVSLAITGFPAAVCTSVNHVVWPHVAHTGTRGTGRRLKAGMVFTIEPMINLGGPEVCVLDDGWTVVTRDRSLSAQFEHTVLVTRDGAEVLTVSPGVAADLHLG